VDQQRLLLNGGGGCCFVSNNSSNKNSANGVINSLFKSNIYPRLPAKLREARIIDLHSISRGFRCLKRFVEFRRGACEVMMVRKSRFSQYICRRYLRCWAYFAGSVSASSQKVELEGGYRHWRSMRLAKGIRSLQQFKCAKEERRAMKRVVVSRLRDGALRFLATESLVRKYGNYLNIMSTAQIAGFIWRMHLMSRVFLSWRASTKAEKHFRLVSVSRALSRLGCQGALRRMERERGCLINDHCR
jgi:hypothetical protein